MKMQLINNLILHLETTIEDNERILKSIMSEKDEDLTESIYYLEQRLMLEGNMLLELRLLSIDSEVSEVTDSKMQPKLRAMINKKLGYGN